LEFRVHKPRAARAGFAVCISDHPPGNGGASGNGSVSYRPLRIGWCIEADDLDHFAKAVTLSHVFWGGRYNPIVPCSDRDLADALIRAFNVDALYNVSGTATVDNFIKEFPYIRWPDFHPQLFAESGAERQPTLLDVTHPAQHLYESHVDRREKPAIDAAFYSWDQGDPLRFALLATCGSYPLEAETGRDYSRLFQRAFAVTPTALAQTDPLPADLFQKPTPGHGRTVPPAGMQSQPKRACELRVIGTRAYRNRALGHLGAFLFTGQLVWNDVYGNTPGSSPNQRGAGEGWMAIYDWNGDGLDEIINEQTDVFWVKDGGGKNLLDRSFETDYSYVLFNKSPDQLRRLGARGGRAHARNRQARRARMPMSPEAVSLRAAPRETTAAAIALLDAQFPWLRRAVRSVAVDSTRRAS
jgi:hypothetical protein